MNSSLRIIMTLLFLSAVGTIRQTDRRLALAVTTADVYCSAVAWFNLFWFQR